MPNDRGGAHPKCPHCGATGQIAEFESGVRWGTVGLLPGKNGGWVTDLGELEYSDWDHDRYQCLECSMDVTAPDSQ